MINTLGAVKQLWDNPFPEENYNLYSLSKDNKYQSFIPTLHEQKRKSL